MTAQEEFIKQVKMRMEAQEAENASLRSQRDELLAACRIALDALGCDRIRQERLRAQELIHAAVKRADTA